MKTPAWLKPGIYGAVIGAAAFGMLGFSWGGWMTGAGASDMADTVAREQVVAAMVPLCLDMARTDPQSATHMATIRAASTFQRRSAIMDTGWATMPGADAPNRDLAQACVDGLDLDAS